MIDNKTKNGNLGELRVAFELTRMDYEVYTGFGGKTSCDLIVIKDGLIQTVQIKSTSYQKKPGSWYIMLQTVRSNKTKNVISKYVSSDFDILAIYIVPEDRVILYKSEKITVTSALSIKAL